MSSFVANTAATALTSVFGNGLQATNVAISALGAGVAGPATPAAVATASAALGVGAGEGTATVITSAVSQISDALPYIGAAISIVTALATGNYRGAGFVAGGAVVGGIIGSVIPGIGTAVGVAVGAAVGGLVSALFPQHPKNPYQSTLVNVVDGKIVAGKETAQLEKTDNARNAINEYGERIDQFLTSVGVKIDTPATTGSPDGNIGSVGRGIKGMVQVDSVDKLFNKLRFKNDEADTSTFGVAKGALTGVKFETPEELVQSLTKLASFADNMTQIGVQLGSVGKDITNITIRGVSQGDPASSDLRTALDHALPGQTFASIDALSAEIDKVNTFVNGTIPGLLKPVMVNQSSIQKQISDVAKTYNEAIDQASRYGLNTSALEQARADAGDLVLHPARKQLDQAQTAISGRAVQAGASGQTEKFLASLADLGVKQDQERTALGQSIADVYGEGVRSTQYFADSMANLNSTLAAETADALAKFSRSFNTAGLTIMAAYQGIRARAATLAGDQAGADLINYDAKAAQERDSYSNQLLDFYGSNFAATADYQNRMTELERVQQGERLAIITKGAAQQNQAQEQAAQSVRGSIASLVDYARGLGTSAASPLDPTAQLDLARSQFQAVSGAAGAGDFNSVSKLQGYTDTFLNASRAVNGSGAAYAADYATALDALNSVSNVAADTLTASYMASIAQTQTDQLVDELRKLRSEVAALRQETKQGAAAPSRIAA